MGMRHTKMFAVGIKPFADKVTTCFADEVEAEDEAERLNGIIGESCNRKFEVFPVLVHFLPEDDEKAQKNID